MSRLVTALAPASEMLAADGYELVVAEHPGRARVEVVAGPDACEDCLVPRDLMLGILRQMIDDAGLPRPDLDLVYPGDAPAAAGGKAP